MTDDAPITAYHGSPHDFEQFDTSKIGTGEGAQAYGHGLYFAENENVAKGYRDDLSPKRMPVFPNDPKLVNKVKYNNELQQELLDELQYAQSQEHYDSLHNKINALDAENKSILGTDKSLGHMYEVAIDAHPDHFLDWDKPISGQSEHAKNAVSNLVADRYLHPTFRNELADLVDRGWFTGEKLHEKLTAKHGLPMAAGLLDKHGLHGIKYFDAGSRGSNEQQTRNYVVFDHNRVKVRRKYEQGGTVAKSPAKLHNPAIVEHVLTKVSAPPPALNPSPVASGDARSKPSGDTYV